MKKTVLSILALIAALCLVLAGCAEEQKPDDRSDRKKDKTKVAETEEVTKPAEPEGYRFPAGAASPYELYGTVIDFLNGGFRYDDLKDVYDLILCYVCDDKMQEKPERIRTLGMKCDEACDLISRLMKAADKMEFLIDDDGEIRMDYIDYAPFVNEFPEEKRAGLGEDNDDFVDFIEEILYLKNLSRDGYNPTHSDQTHWNRMTKEEFDAQGTPEYDDYTEFDKDLFLNFPRIYMIDLGTYISGSDAITTGIRFVQIKGRYYFIGFSILIGSIGG